jgi:uncharacterized protein YndB with AHSA1/START domain
MSELFVVKTIEIKAPIAKVWDVLTRREQTGKWASEFTGGAPFYIESEWKLGSPVLWKDQNGTVIVEGTVTALEQHTLLRFTVFDVRGEKPPVTEEDGITYRLREQDGKTTLQVLQGDFSTMADAEKYHRMSEEIWERVLPKVKALAEPLSVHLSPSPPRGRPQGYAPTIHDKSACLPLSSLDPLINLM